MSSVPLPYNSEFEPAWWCHNPHLQTLWPQLFRRRPEPLYRRERIWLKDGDFIDLDWHGPEPTQALVIILHGLEGSSSSHYVRGLVSALAREDIPTTVMHQRGCTGPNLLDRRYHAGNTPDLHEVLSGLKQRLKNCWLHVVGYSLGGNVLLKYLGEKTQLPLADSASAVSVPFLLGECAKRLDQGISKLYRNYLVSQMRTALRNKFRERPAPIDLSGLSRWKSFFDFDEHVTARLHGFKGVEDYYQRCSSRQFLATIETPTLIVQAADDPFLTPEVLPSSSELGPGIDFELSRYGGHVGFISGHLGNSGRYWLEQRLCDDAIEKIAMGRSALLPG